jgi:hypothetical protein
MSSAKLSVKMCRAASCDSCGACKSYSPTSTYGRLDIGVSGACWSPRGHFFNTDGSGRPRRARALRPNCLSPARDLDVAAQRRAEARTLLPAVNGPESARDGDARAGGAPVAHYFACRSSCVRRNSSFRMSSSCDCSCSCSFSICPCCFCTSLSSMA